MALCGEEDKDNDDDSVGCFPVLLLTLFVPVLLMAICKAWGVV
jgi:hypothetical protein